LSAVSYLDQRLDGAPSLHERIAQRFSGSGKVRAFVVGEGHLFSGAGEITGVSFARTSGNLLRDSAGTVEVTDTSSAYARSFSGCDVVHINRSSVSRWWWMVSIRPKERSETADALADNRPFRLRNYELHAAVGTYGQLRRYSRPFFWQSNSLGL
jgi:hypothetical protein